MMPRVLSPLFVMAFLLSSCTPAAVVPSTAPLPQRAILLRSDDGRELPLQVEVASTPEQKAAGLMNRKNVPNGMLFVFEGPRVLSFWMKDTLVPLDILFFAQDGSFTGSMRMEPCRADLCPSYFSPGPAQYALEMPAGFVEEKEVGMGWKIEGVPEEG